MIYYFYLEIEIAMRSGNSLLLFTFVLYKFEPKESNRVKI